MRRFGGARFSEASAGVETPGKSSAAGPSALSCLDFAGVAPRDTSGSCWETSTQCLPTNGVAFPSALTAH